MFRHFFTLMLLSIYTHPLVLWFHFVIKIVYSIELSVARVAHSSQTKTKCDYKFTKKRPTKTDDWNVIWRFNASLYLWLLVGIKSNSYCCQSERKMIQHPWEMVNNQKKTQPTTPADVYLNSSTKWPLTLNAYKRTFCHLSYAIKIIDSKLKASKYALKLYLI